MRTYLFLCTLFFSLLSFAKTEVFFGTFFTDIPNHEMKNELERLGAERAGRADLGSILRGSPYYHFNLPRETVPELFMFLNKKGNLIIENSQTSEIDNPEYIRFIIWQAPLKKFSRLSSETLFIHRIVNNPDREIQRLKDFLEENNIKYSGQKVIDFSLSNIKQFNELAQHMNEAGSYLLHQNKEWNNKIIRISFSQSSKIFKKKTTALGLTVISKDSEKAVLKLVDELGFQKTSNKWRIKNSPSSYIALSKNGTLSVIPAESPTKFADLTISNVFRFTPTPRPAPLKTPPTTVKVSPPISHQPIEDSFLVEQENIKKAEAENDRVKMRDSKYPFVANLGSEKIFFESAPEYTTVLNDSTLRGYYEGSSPLLWNQAVVATKDKHFELHWQNNLSDNESTGTFSVGSNNQDYKIKKFNANEIVFAGSAYQTAAKKIATMSHLEYERAIERPFDVNRSSMLFDQSFLNLSYTLITQAINGANYQDISFKFKHRWNRPNIENMGGLISYLNLHNTVSANFNGYLLGAGLEYEMNFPFPLFEYWPKRFIPFFEFDLGGVGINISKSFYAGFRGKMYFTNNFYIHGSVGRLEQNIEHISNYLSTTLSFGLTRFEGGFGYRF